MNTLMWLHDEPAATGRLKVFPEDFVVIEDLGFEPDSEGEHLLLRIRKEGCNTQFVADYLARWAKIPARSVSYAGLKDRHAITEQWFCLHLPGKAAPDLYTFSLENCEIITSARHRKKLRTGALKGNAFQLILRHIDHFQDVEQRLARIKSAGVPNYFGEQRFGHAGNNVTQARLWASGDITVRERNRRSFYLSAARSLIFNEITSARIRRGTVATVLSGDVLQLAGRGSWFVAKDDELSVLQQRITQKELNITALLPGIGDAGTQNDALLFEQGILTQHKDLVSLLLRERVESARRAMLVMPGNLQWEWQDEVTLSLSFWLPAGSFATSVVRELMRVENNAIDVSL